MVSQSNTPIVPHPATLANDLKVNASPRSLVERRRELLALLGAVDAPRLPRLGRYLDLSLEDWARRSEGTAA